MPPPADAAGVEVDRPTPGRTRAGRRVAIGSASLVALGLAVGAGWWLGWIPTRLTPPSAERVEQLIAAGQFEDAIDEANALLAVRDDDPRAIWLLARAQTGSGDLEAAVESLRKVPDWSLRKPEALFYEGKALMKLRRAREAERIFRDLIDRGTPMTPNARLELLALYAMEERGEDFKAAFWSLYPSLGEEDRLPVLTMRLRIEFEQVKPELNAQELREMVAAEPHDPDALAGLAAAEVHAEDLDSARSHFAEALRLRPDDPRVRERYLDVLHRQGDMKAFREVLENRPPGSESRPEMAKFLGIAAQSAGDLEAAAGHFATACQADPTVAEYHHRRSQVLFQLGKRDEATAAAAERDRLNEARAALRKAWDLYADVVENRPEELTIELVDGMARACEASGLVRESGAWAAEASRMKREGRAPSDTVR